MIQKKRIFYWALYDFANTLAMIVFFLYFTQWLVIEKGVSDLTYNLIYVAASVLLVLTGPVLSILADKWKNRLVFLRPVTMLCFLSYILCAVVANFFPSEIGLAILGILLANFFYQLSYVFYTPLLYDVSSAGKRGSVSGIGGMAGWLGQIAGLLITLPFVGAAHPWFGVVGRPQAFFPAAIIFIILALPLLVWFKEEDTSNIRPLDVGKELRGFGSKVKMLWLVPGVAFFLGAFFFFNDAILTAANNFPIYLAKVFGISDSAQSFSLLGILITSALGALVAGRMADRFGARKMLEYILFGWVVIMLLIAYQTSFAPFAGLLVIMGFLYGGVFAVGRTLMAELAPVGQRNFAFGLYALTDRFATFIGPVGWGLTLHFGASLGKDAYRLAFITMTVFVVVGLCVVRRIPKIVDK